MKKSMLIGLALGVVALTATAAFAGIETSKHDLSSTGASASLGNDPQDRICVYCHHPHNTVRADSAGAFGYSPLWNRDIPATALFTAYTNSVGDTMMGDASSAKHLMNGTPEIGGVSLLCMSCHDGSTAMNAFSQLNPQGATGSFVPGLATGSDVITGVAALGFDLSNHHPIRLTT